MKRLLTLSLTIGLAASGTAFAQQGDHMKEMHKDMPMDMPMNMSKDAHEGMKSQESGKKETVHHATGTVKSTDPAKGTVTVAHGEVKSLKWPAMTMTFLITDKTLLEKVKVGSEIEFDFKKQGSKYIITEIK